MTHIGYLQQTPGEIDAARKNFQKALQLRQRNQMKVFVPFALIALMDFEAEQSRGVTAVFGDPSGMKEAEDFLKSHM